MKIKNVEIDNDTDTGHCILTVQLRVAGLAEALGFLQIVDADALNVAASAMMPEPKASTPAPKKRNNRKLPKAKVENPPTILFIPAVGDVLVEKTKHGHTLTVKAGEHKDLTASGDTREEATSNLLGLIADAVLPASDPDEEEAAEHKTPDGDPEPAPSHEPSPVRVETAPPLEEGPPQALLSAGSFRHVMDWMVEQIPEAVNMPADETTDPARNSIVELCESYRATVPAISRIKKDTLPQRVDRALTVHRAKAAQ